MVVRHGMEKIDVFEIKSRIKITNKQFDNTEAAGFFIAGVLSGLLEHVW